MKSSLSDRVIVPSLARLALVLPAMAAAWAGDRELRHFPTGYRYWPVTRFRLRNPATSNYATRSDFRHYDANDVAFWSRGRFRDGAVGVEQRGPASLNAREAWEEAGSARFCVQRAAPLTG
jgi:hypothetical protein